MTLTNGCEQELVLLLADYLADGFEPTGNGRHEAPEVSREIGNPVLNDIVSHEIRKLVAKDRQLLDAIEKARRHSNVPPPAKLRRSIEIRLERRLRNDPDLLDALGALLPRHADTTDEQQLRSSRFGWIRAAMKRFLAAASLAAIIAVVVAAAAWLDGKAVGSLTAVEVFATAVLAFLPGWLFVRFLAFRAGALWNEYVLNLHRLDLDARQHLPRPPENSIYFRKWWAAGGWVRERAPTIYQQKFDAYYGRNVSQATHQHDPIVRTETLFPVLLMTAIVATGWVAVFQGGRILEAPPSRLSDMLGYAFVGAYLFNLQTFVRRFFQGDLKASAYAGGAVRIITALVIVAVLYWLPEPDLQGRSGAVVAFVVGIFPLVGIQVLTRAASVVLRMVVPTLRSDYPLSELDGLNIWYETRLSEEGIEDMQNLTTMNLVDVMLHTRVPLGRLIDWLDQATLYMNLPRSPRLVERRRALRNARRAATAIRESSTWAEKPAAPLAAFEPTHPRELLRRCGIRTATEFVDVFRPLITDGDQSNPDCATARSAAKWLTSKDEAWRGALRPLTRILAGETALEPVRSWHDWRQREDDLDPPVRRHVGGVDGRSLDGVLVGAVDRT